MTASFFHMLKAASVFYLESKAAVFYHSKEGHVSMTFTS